MGSGFDPSLVDKMSIASSQISSDDQQSIASSSDEVKTTSRGRSYSLGKVMSSKVADLFFKGRARSATFMTAESGGSVTKEKAICKESKVDSSFDVKLLRENFIKKCGSREDAHKALLFLLSTDSRFTGKSKGVSADIGKLRELNKELNTKELNTEDSEYFKDIETVLDAMEAFKKPELLSDKEKKTISERIDTLINKLNSSEDFDKLTQKNIKKIKDRMVVFLKRDNVVQKYTSSKGVLEFTQKNGHLEKGENEQCVFTQDGRSSSADVQKKEETTTLANGAVVTCKGEDGQEEVVICRSSRTDTPSKVYQKSVMDITSRLATASKKGLKREGDHYSYRRMDQTLMDQDFLKGEVTTLKTRAKSFINQLKGRKGIPTENERKFIQEKRSAVKKLFIMPDGVLSMEKEVDGVKVLLKRENLKSEVYIEHNINGDTVREYAPLVPNTGYTDRGVLAENVKGARAGNEPTYLACLETALKGAGSQMQFVNTAFAKYKGEPSSENKEALLGALRLSAGRCVGSKQEKMVKILQAIHFGLSGQEMPLEKLIFKVQQAPKASTEPGEFDNAMGCVKESLYLGSLAEALGMAFSTECKSGNDRTAEAVALEVARKRFVQETGREPLLLPGEGPSNYDFAMMQKFFREAIIDFGVNNVKASRGNHKEHDRPILKVGGHGVFQLFADDAFVEELRQHVVVKWKGETR